MKPAVKSAERLLARPTERERLSISAASLKRATRRAL